MFFKILKKDFKRKKVMNVILFIFMLTASILIASSTNLLYSTITAVDYFIGKSKVADVITLTKSDQKVTNTMKDWAENSKIVEDYRTENMIFVDEDKVSASSGGKLKNAGSVVVSTKPEKYNLIFDCKGNDFKVGPSQIAVPVSIQKKMGLSIGDRLTLEINGYRQEFTVSYIFKDAVLGAELMSMKRIIINEQAFNKFYRNSEDKLHYLFWEFSKSSGSKVKDLEKEISDLSVTTDVVLSKDMISTVYAMDMALAAVMILVSIFLILISFLILRFTIVFTVMEDYQQIGVMKAIGLKSINIRGMYCVKYLTLSVISGVIGFALSFPVSNLMKRRISDYILLKQSVMNNIIALISVITVVGITMLFCNSCTGKVKKISAIDAIRQGSTGERFKNTKKLKLNRRKRMNIPLFLACSDIISDFKKYIILIITFILGTAIIIIPNNIITTLSSDNTITLFGFCHSDFYVRDDFLGNQKDAMNHIKELQTEFTEAGFKTELRADLSTAGYLYTDDLSDRINILGFQGVDIDSGEYDYLEGKAPVLADEIAVTEKVAKYLGVDIGDNVICDIQGEKKEYIITALFQTMNTLGNAVRLPESYSAAEGSTTSVTVSGMLAGTAKEKEDQVNRMKEEFPGLKIHTGKEVTNSFVGYLTKQINALKTLVFFLVAGINFLITSLLLRMLISKEVPEIAILKSLGFQSISIKRWQVNRIGIILAVSIIIGTILANSMGNTLNARMFQIMGITRLHLITEPFEVFFLYPVMLFVITMLAVVLSLGQVKKTHVWELNNQE